MVRESEEQPRVQGGVPPGPASRGHAQPPGEDLQLCLQHPHLGQHKVVSEARGREQGGTDAF